MTASILSRSVDKLVGDNRSRSINKMMRINSRMLSFALIKDDYRAF